MRHIVNPHCDQDEGLRIVWSESDEWEVNDWDRRDAMMRQGKTVQAEEGNDDDQDIGQAVMAGPPMVGPMDFWDNTVWTTLPSRM